MGGFACFNTLTINCMCFTSLLTHVCGLISYVQGRPLFSFILKSNENQLEVFPIHGIYSTGK